jgi:alanyl-tRNA synthetase
MKIHQETSRIGSEQKFKGGLANTNEQTVKLHTAHHLLLAALRRVLGEHVHQRGRNITDERIRIDFSHDAKMTDEQKTEVEKLVNEWITQDLPMQRVEMPRAEAEQIGAEMEFGVKYPDTVSVYFIGDNLDSAISKEFCGGPHIERTGLIGTFKIQKEEASSAGVRRIKATIE